MTVILIHLFSFLLYRKYTKMNKVVENNNNNNAWCLIQFWSPKIVALIQRTNNSSSSKDFVSILLIIKIGLFIQLIISQLLWHRLLVIDRQIEIKYKLLPLQITILIQIMKLRLVILQKIANSSQIFLNHKPRDPKLTTMKPSNQTVYKLLYYPKLLKQKN